MVKENLENLLMSDSITEEEVFKLFPELINMKCSQNHPAHKKNVIQHTLEVVEYLPKDLTLRLTGLFHDIGKPYARREVNGVDRFWGHESISSFLTREILSKLNFDSNIIEDVCTLITYHDTIYQDDFKSVKDIKDKLGSVELLEKLMIHQEADMLAHSEEYIKKHNKKLLEKNENIRNFILEEGLLD